MNQWRFNGKTFFNLLSQHHRLSDIVISLKKNNKLFLHDIDVDKIKNAEDYTRNNPDSPESYNFRKFLESVETETIDELTNTNSRNFVRNDTALLEDRLSKEDHGFDLTSVYGAHKSSPHHVESTLLKYLIHRIENNDQYKQVDTETANDLDSAFLKHHQQGQAAEKNGGLTVEHLQKFMKNKGTERLANELINYRKQLHNYILENHPESIEEINGEPHIRLTRGLNVPKSERGIDHALASYADIARTGFGQYMHHQMVPLKNVWSSYDNLPRETLHENFDTENEFLVSPHQNIYNQDFETSPTKPITIDNYHSLEPLEGKRAADHFANQGSTYPLRQLQDKPFLHKKLYKDPDFSRELLMQRPEWYNAIRDMFFIGNNFDKVVKANAHNKKVLEQMPEDSRWSDEHTSLVIREQPWTAIEKLPISKIKAEHIRQFANHLDTKYTPDLAHSIYSKLRETPQYDIFAKDNPESHEYLKNSYVKIQSAKEEESEWEDNQFDYDGPVDLASSIKKDIFNLKKSINKMKNTFDLKLQIEQLKKSIESFQSLYVEYIEPLEKNQKLPHYIKFMGDHPKAEETAQWATSLKHRNLAEFGMRHAKTKPEGLNDEEKTQIEHFNNSLHMPEVATAAGSLTKDHDFTSGLKILQDGEAAYQKKHAQLAPKLAPLEGDKLLDLGDGVAVYRLPLNENGKNEGEATAMGHCATPHKGGELWSIRKDHGNGMCEPMVTISHEGGYLGEIKGKHNWKPSDRHHGYIAKLMASDLVQGYVGGGYRPESNFDFDDMKEGLKKKLLDYKPSLTEDVYKEFLPPGLKDKSYSQNSQIKTIFRSNNRNLIKKFLTEADPDSKEMKNIRRGWTGYGGSEETFSSAFLHELFHFFKQNKFEDPKLFENVADTIIRSKNANSELLDEIVDHHPAIYKNYRFLEHKNLSSSTIEKILSNNPLSGTEWKVVEHKNAPQELINKFNANEYGYEVLASSEHISDENLQKLMQKPNKLNDVARNPRLSKEQLDYLWNKRHSMKNPYGLVDGVIHHPNTSDDFLEKILNDLSNDVINSTESQQKDTFSNHLYNILSKKDLSSVSPKLLHNLIEKLSSPDLVGEGNAANSIWKSNKYIAHLDNLSLESLQHLYSLSSNPKYTNDVFAGHSATKLKTAISAHPKFELFSDEIKQKLRPFMNIPAQKLISIMNDNSENFETKKQANEEFEIRKQAKYNKLFSEGKDIRKIQHLAESADDDIAERAIQVLRKLGLRKSLKNEIQQLKKSIKDLKKAKIGRNLLGAGANVLGLTSAMLAPSQIYDTSSKTAKPPSEITSTVTPELAAADSERMILEQPKTTKFIPSSGNRLKPAEPQYLSSEDMKNLKPLKSGEKIFDFNDPRHIPTEEFFEKQYNLPHRSLTCLRVCGERSNWKDTNKNKTLTPYQFTSNTRNLFIKTHGIDPWEDTKSAIESAAIHLAIEGRNYINSKDSHFKHINDEDIQNNLLFRHFNGGNNINSWKEENQAYGIRSHEGLKFLQQNSTAYDIGENTAQKYSKENIQKTGISKEHFKLTDIPSLKLLNQRDKYDTAKKIQDISEKVQVLNPKSTNKSLQKDIVDLKKSISKLKKNFQLPLFLEYIEPLEKSEKLPHYIKFMGNHPKAQETAEWSANNINHRSLAEFGMRQAKKTPEGLTTDQKSKLKYYSDSLHMPEVAQAAGTLTKDHDFESGIKILENAENAYKQRHADEAPKLVPHEGKKILDFGDNVGVYKLPLNKKSGKNENSATAMGHCGTPTLGDLWEIRKDHGNGMCEPLVTLDHVNGYLGQIKGKHNWKPHPRNHKYIVQLMLSKKISGYIGGGPAYESNFEFSDLNDDFKKTILQQKPSLFNQVYLEDLPKEVKENDEYILPPEIKSKYSALDLNPTLFNPENLASKENISPEILHQSSHSVANEIIGDIEHFRTTSLSQTDPSFINYLRNHLNAKNSKRRQILQKFFNNSALSSETIDSLVNLHLSNNLALDNNSELIRQAVNHRNITSNTLNTIHNLYFERYKNQSEAKQAGLIAKLNEIPEFSNDINVLSNLAANKKTDKSILNNLALNTDEPLIHSAVAANPNTDSDILHYLFNKYGNQKNNNSSIIEKLINNPNTRHESIINFLNQDEQNIHRYVHELASKSKDENLLMNIFSNILPTHQGKRSLFNDLLDNPNVPANVLHMGATSDLNAILGPEKDSYFSNFSIKQLIAEHKNTPPEILQNIYEQYPDNQKLHLILAKNANTPIDTLKHIINKLSIEHETIKPEEIPNFSKLSPDLQNKISLLERPFKKENIQKLISIAHDQSTPEAKNFSIKAHQEIKRRREEKYNKILSSEGSEQDLLHLAESYDPYYSTRARAELKRRGLLKSVKKEILDLKKSISQFKKIK